MTATGKTAFSTPAAETLPPPRQLGWKWWQALEWAVSRLRRFPAAIPAHHVGRRGEDLAYWSLRQRGYTIIARNYRLPGCEGEVDLIAWEGNPPCLVFVEVKTRSREGRFTAEDAVNVEKRRHLRRLARAFRRWRRHLGPYRFDVVAVYGPDTGAPELRLYRHAFGDH